MQFVTDRALSFVIAAASVAIAVVLVHREFGARDRAPAALPALGAFVRVPDWERVESAARSVGPESAPIRGVEFMDLECPFCAQLYRNTARLRADSSGDVVFFFVHTPITSHRFARPAARAAECAATQGKFPGIVDVIYTHQDSLGLKSWTSFAADAGVVDTAAFAKCVQRSDPMPLVDAGVEAGRRVGVTGTPTVLVNGWRFSRPPTEAELSDAIGRVRAGQPPGPLAAASPP